MDRRKFLIGMGSLAAGSAAAMGTGAFTTMTAERTANINVVDDTDGLIGLVPDGEQVWKENGELYIDTSVGNGDGENPDGSYGVNVHSQYQFGQTDDPTFGAGTSGGPTSVEEYTSNEDALSAAYWFGTHRSNGDEVDSHRALYSITEGYLDDENVDVDVSEPFFTVQNNDTQSHDIRLTFDDKIVSILGQELPEAYEEPYIDFPDVAPGDTIDIALVIMAGDDKPDAEGSIKVTAN